MRHSANRTGNRRDLLGLLTVGPVAVPLSFASAGQGALQDSEAIEAASGSAEIFRTIDAGDWTKFRQFVNADFRLAAFGSLTVGADAAVSRLSRLFRLSGQCFTTIQVDQVKPVAPNAFEVVGRAIVIVTKSLLPNRRGPFLVASYGFADEMTWSGEWRCAARLITDESFAPLPW